MKTTWFHGFEIAWGDYGPEGCDLVCRVEALDWWDEIPTERELINDYRDQIIREERPRVSMFEALSAMARVQANECHAKWRRDVGL